jgi:hypothetical protein
MTTHTSAIEALAQQGIHPIDGGLDGLTPEADTAMSQAYLLSMEVTALWGDHRLYQTRSKEMRGEAARIRTELAEVLHRAKELLSVPGCAGKWNEYLRKHGIPRSSAERLVSLHERALHPGSCTVRTSPDPTQKEIRKLVRAVLPRILRVIPSAEYFDKFMLELRAAFENTAAERAQKQAAVEMVSPESEQDSPLATFPVNNHLPWLVAGEVM